ncbi:MAG TPA: chromate transporter [Chloroflexi bacterium]|nr:chromate transporter [Chloroflexota bacterium]
MLGFQLFFTFLKIGFLAIGGAYSFLPLFEEELVENYAWITRDEFADIIAITEFFPGAKSVKFATYAGYKLMGIPGVIIANLGNFLPPALMVVLATKFYFQYKDHPAFQNAFTMIKIAVIAMIFNVALKMIEWKEIFQLKTGLVFLGSFVFGYFFDIHPAIIIVVAGIVGIVFA